AQRRGLARTVGPEQRDHLPLRHLQRQIQGELAPGDTEARGQGHRVTIHRSRSATSTATDTSSSTRLNTIAASGSDSSARYTANGMVVVRPGKLPAKVMVAPNSPSARAQHNTAPATRPGATDGSVTRRKAYQRPAPSVAAASSKRGSAARSAPSTEITRNGIATNASATITPAVVNGSDTPNHSCRYRPTNPRRPNASSNATPPTTGGNTSGTVTSARTS